MTPLFRPFAPHLVAVALLLPAVMPSTAAGQSGPPTAQDSARPSTTPSIDAAQYLFYTGLYAEAAGMALALREAEPNNLATFELRSSALHFQLKRALGEPADKAAALKACVTCAAILADFVAETTRGAELARVAVEKNPEDNAALFYLGKIDLNYIWLQLGTVGRRTGWSEYREARRSLETVLKADPTHVRARVARAWIDYIVDTRVTRGFRWILGGGDKKRGLETIRQAAIGNGTFYEKAEAGFALWEIEVREKNIPAALVAARGLARDFPENKELAVFVAKHGP